MPTPTRNLYKDQALTNVSVRFSNDPASFIADKVAPRVTVPALSGVYYVYDKQNLKRADSKRTGYARANRIDFGLTEAPYGPLQEHSLESAILWRDRDAAKNPLNLRVDATEQLTEMLTIEHEADVAALFANAAVTTKGETLTDGNQFEDASVDPFPVIRRAINNASKNGFRKANTLIMGRAVWDRLIDHSALLERIKYSEKGVVTTDLLATLFGVQNVYIGEAQYNTAIDGATDATGYIWGNNLYAAYVTPNPGLKTISAAYTLQLDQGRYVDGWTEQEYKADIVRVNDNYEVRLIAAEAVYRVTDAVGS